METSKQPRLKLRPRVALHKLQWSVIAKTIPTQFIEYGEVKLVFTWNLYPMI